MREATRSRIRGEIGAAIEHLKAANAALEAERLEADEARGLIRDYGRAESLAAYGLTRLAATVRDAAAVAQATGTSVGRAKQRLATDEALQSATKTRNAFRSGRISADQASEIAKAEVAAPGSADELLKLAATQSFHVLRDKARKAVLEAEQHRDLGERQRKARTARVGTDELGMVDIALKLQPHIGTPLVNRAETEAKRRYQAAKKTGTPEPFPAYLADAFAAMLAGNAIKPNSKRPELVVLVSHEVAKRGWSDVKPGEVCKIPGVGPVPPEVAREIAQDAFLNGVFFDGTDLRTFKRWNRNVPVEIQVALELGDPPRGGLGRTAGQDGFDGAKCVDCEGRLHPERDHHEPVIAGGPTALGNFKWRCWPCHVAKTARDRAAGKLKPRAGPVASMAG